MTLILNIDFNWAAKMLRDAQRSFTSQVGF
jgi:hypothetical protein